MAIFAKFRQRFSVRKDKNQNNMTDLPLEIYEALLSENNYFELPIKLSQYRPHNNIAA